LTRLKCESRQLVGGEEEPRDSGGERRVPEAAPGAGSDAGPVGPRPQTDPAAVESRSCLARARARDRSAEHASAMPEIRENASITRKRRIWIPINIHPWPIAAEPPKSVRWLTDYAITTETRWRAYIFSLHCARHTCEIFARRCHMANAAGRLVRVRAVPRLWCNVSQTYNPQHRGVTLPVETYARY
jgi:hypothetical protein